MFIQWNKDDLEALGLIYAPHVSAGRIPTHTGLRLFVDGLLEVGDIDDAERDSLERQLRNYAAGSPGVSAEVLAREIGGRVVLIDPLADDFIGNMRTIETALKEAML